MISAYNTRHLSDTLPMSWYTLDIWTALSLIVSELLPFCSFLQANGLLHGLLLCWALSSRKWVLLSRKTTLITPQSCSWKLRRRMKSVRSAPRCRRALYTSSALWENTKHPNTLLSPSIETQARQPPLQKVDSSPWYQETAREGQPPTHPE
jgi:hypothetical protein